MTSYLIQNAAPLGGEPTDLLLTHGVIGDVGQDLEAPEGTTMVDAAFRAQLDDPQQPWSGPVRCAASALVTGLAGRAIARATLG